MLSDEQLKMFCGNPETQNRPGCDLSTPFEDGNWICATNAIVAVAVWNEGGDAFAQRDADHKHVDLIDKLAAYTKTREAAGGRLEPLPGAPWNLRTSRRSYAVDEDDRIHVLFTQACFGGAWFDCRYVALLMMLPGLKVWVNATRGEEFMIGEWTGGKVVLMGIDDREDDPEPTRE